MMNSFKEILISAKTGNEEAVSEIFELYKALIYKESIVDGVFDPDLNQLLYKTLYQCILRFKIF